MRGRKFLIFHFVLFGLLTALAQIPTTGVFLALILTFGTIGLVMVATAATVLLYSAALLPAWIVAVSPLRSGWRIAATLLIPAAIATVPGALSVGELHLETARVTGDDFSKAARGQPRSIELIGDWFSGLYGDGAGHQNAPCGDACRRLLFNREVESVRVTTRSLPTRNAPSNVIGSVSYRIERRESCPEAYPEGSRIDKAIRDRIIAGDCLVAAAAIDDQPPQARISVLTLHDWRLLPQPDVPWSASVKLIRRLRIEQLQGAVTTVILQRTEIQTEPLALPFYFNYDFRNALNGLNGQRFGRVARTINAVDGLDVLRTTFGFKLLPVEPPQAEGVGEIVDRILSLPASVETFSAQQQDLIDDLLKAIHKDGTPSDTDLARIKNVIADRRVTSSQIGADLATLFRKHPDRMASLIPIVIDRLTVPVPERVGHYQSHLGGSLNVYAAAQLQPYRDTIVAIVEAQPDWPSAGLLVRLGDLEGDASDLLARRLESKSYRVRQAAASAICRATPEKWVKLEPIVLANLRPETKNGGLLDGDRQLLLALIRFGKKDTADRLLGSINPANKEWTERWLAAQAADLPKRCGS
jgi:hypothetical protein